MNLSAIPVCALSVKTGSDQFLPFIKVDKNLQKKIIKKQISRIIFR